MNTYAVSLTSTRYNLQNGVYIHYHFILNKKAVKRVIVIS